MFIFPRKS